MTKEDRACSKKGPHHPKKKKKKSRRKRGRGQKIHFLADFLEVMASDPLRREMTTKKKKKKTHYSVRFDISYASRVTGEGGILHASRLSESKVSNFLQNY